MKSLTIKFSIVVFLCSIMTFAIMDAGCKSSGGGGPKPTPTPTPTAGPTPTPTATPTPSPTPTPSCDNVPSNMKDAFFGQNAVTYTGEVVVDGQKL